MLSTLTAVYSRGRRHPRRMNVDKGDYVGQMIAEDSFLPIFQMFV